MEIEKILPHGPGFRFVSRVESLNSREIVAIFDVPVDAFWVPHHFPGNPILPGVILIEALAQTMILHYHEIKNIPVDKVLFAAVDGFRFKRMIHPGEELTLKAAFVDDKHGMATYDCEAYVGVNLAGRGRLTGTFGR